MNAPPQTDLFSPLGENVSERSVSDDSDSECDDRVRCPQGCPRPFKRRAEMNRHLEEQHRCAATRCKDRLFNTPAERNEHQSTQHIGEVLGFECGSCSLNGRLERFKRFDKLEAHYKSIHKIVEKISLDSFRCMEPSCRSSLQGGLFFLSHAALEKHHQKKHRQENSRFAISNQDGGK